MSTKSGPILTLFLTGYLLSPVVASSQQQQPQYIATKAQQSLSPRSEIILRYSAIVAHQVHLITLRNGLIFHIPRG